MSEAVDQRVDRRGEQEQEERPRVGLGDDDRHDQGGGDCDQGAVVGGLGGPGPGVGVVVEECGMGDAPAGDASGPIKVVRG